MHSLGQTYTHAVHRAGGVPVILPPILTAQDWPVLIERLDGLLLSGGEDIAPRHYGEKNEAWLSGVDTARDQSELGLIRLWYETGKPLFAICRGHQALNVALGGALYQDIAAYLPDALDHAYAPGRPMEEPVHSISIEPNSRLAEILGGTTFEVNSAHHQSLKKPGRGLYIVATAPDGVAEATEDPHHPFCLSVQWHPEAMVKISDTMWPLFERFVSVSSG